MRFVHLSWFSSIVWLKIWFFHSTEYLSPSVVNVTFLCYLPRNTQMVSAMKKAGVSAILLIVILLAVAVIGEAQQPKKVPRLGIYQIPIQLVSPPVPRELVEFCAPSAT